MQHRVRNRQPCGGKMRHAQMKVTMRRLSAAAIKFAFGGDVMGRYGFLKFSLVAAALASTPAVAADNARPPAYRGGPAYAVVYDWTGFYIGGHLGVAWSTGDNSDAAFLGGGQAGFNYQVGQWVFG